MRDYVFTHKETRHHIIIQAFSPWDFTEENSDYRLNDRLTYSAESKIPYFENHEGTEINEKLNNFWKGAVGHQKTGRLGTTGIYCTGIYNGMRMALRQLHNHACMSGDVQTIKAVKKADGWFYDRGSYQDKPNIQTLLLTN